jgi:iron-sulfur cluster assembly protein
MVGQRLRAARILGIVAGPHDPNPKETSMLTLTQTAAEAVKSIVANVPQAEDGGIRIRDTGPQTGFELSVAPTPEPDDTVVVTDGARVFLDAPAAQALDDRVLDAEMVQDGSVRFALATQG